MKKVRKENISLTYKNSEILIEGETFTFILPMTTSDLYKVYSTGKGTGFATLKLLDQEEETMKDVSEEDKEEVVEGRAILNVFQPNRIQERKDAEEKPSEVKDEEENTEFKWRPHNYFNKKLWNDNP